LLISSPGWHFKRRERADEVADPFAGEFFDEAGGQPLEQGVVHPAGEVDP